MAYRFKRKEPVTKAIRRLTCESVTHAIDRLHEPDRVEAIHGARKDIDRLAGYWHTWRREKKSPALLAVV